MAQGIFVNGIFINGDALSTVGTFLEHAVRLLHPLSKPDSTQSEEGKKLNVPTSPPPPSPKPLVGSLKRNRDDGDTGQEESQDGKDSQDGKEESNDSSPQSVPSLRKKSQRRKTVQLESSDASTDSNSNEDLSQTQVLPCCLLSLSLSLSLSCWLVGWLVLLLLTQTLGPLIPNLCCFWSFSCSYVHSVSIWRFIHLLFLTRSDQSCRLALLIRSAPFHTATREGRGKVVPDLLAVRAAGMEDGGKPDSSSSFLS